jgi:hypothetical protein
MASPKRERQREAAAKRREAQAEQRKRDARRRSVLRTVGLVGAALALAALFSFVINRDDDKSSDVASDTSASTESSQDGSDQTSSVSSSALSGRTISGETPCPKADGSEERVAAFEKAPPMCIDVAKTYTATISTTEGDYTAVLDAKAAPKTVNNFVVLARYHFYDGVIFHRIIDGFMCQGGDPDGTTDILVSEAYRWAFTRDAQYGYAAAYAVLIFVLLLGLSRGLDRLRARALARGGA